jgi:hypothetical protein
VRPRITAGAYSRWARRPARAPVLGRPRGISCRGGRRAATSVPPREPCLSGEVGGVEACGSAVHRVTDLAPPGARAVGCLDGGADMCAQLWVSKAQVGGGGGLELVVIEGGPCPLPARLWASFVISHTRTRTLPWRRRPCGTLRSRLHARWSHRCPVAVPLSPEPRGPCASRVLFLL